VVLPENYYRIKKIDEPFKNKMSELKNKLDFANDKYYSFITCNLKKLGKVYVVFDSNGLSLYKRNNKNIPIQFLKIRVCTVSILDTSNNELITVLKNFNCNIEYIKKKKKYNRIKHENKKYYQNNEKHCKTIEDCPAVALKILSFLEKNIKKDTV
jgi:hypothetical protein